MNIRYLTLRVIRHFLPSSFARFLLRRGWIIRPGLETSAPEAAAQRYADVFSGLGYPISGKRVLVFGYGGHFAIACALLKLGARHVVLCEKDAPPDHQRNMLLLPEYPDYLRAVGDEVLPDPAYITLAQGDIRQLAEQKQIEPCDLIMSTSVYEHLGDVPGITQALANLTCKDGAQLHFVDLRDHFFKHPFEMLCYSEKVWYGWLNPTSNHNRCRYMDYQKVFSRFFEVVDIEPFERNEAAFLAAKARIRPEFLTGDLKIDSITQIRVFVSGPKV
jgi:hypothetical protein